MHLKTCAVSVGLMFRMQCDTAALFIQRVCVSVIVCSFNQMPSRFAFQSKAPSVNSDVKSSRTSWPRGRNFVLGLGLEHLSSNFSLMPCENECNAGTGNHRELSMIIYQSYLLTNLVLLI